MIHYIYHIFYINIYGLQLSPQIKQITGWKSRSKTVEEIHEYFTTNFKTKDGKLDLMGKAGDILRTMNPEEYFIIVEYDKNIKLRRKRPRNTNKNYLLIIIICFVCMGLLSI